MKRLLLMTRKLNDMYHSRKCHFITSAKVQSQHQNSNLITSSKVDYFVENHFIQKLIQNHFVESQNLLRMIESQLVVKSTNGIFSISDWVKKP
jgi:hypothetical protein